jgi:hypothetical protein
VSGSPIADVVAGARRDLELAWASQEQRALELTETERYARDPVAWIAETPIWVASKFGEGGRVRPVRFRLFPDQAETIDAWIDLEHLAETGELKFRNVAIEKSRQIGETWLFAVVVLWVLTFHRTVGLAMHRKGAEIDDGGQRNTVKSLFGKIRYVSERLGSDNGLPDPAARARLAGVSRLAFRPFSQGQIDDPGRGGTFDYVLIDEAAFVEHGEKVHAALSDACPTGKAYLSTVNGDGNVHARLCDEKPKGWRYLRLHWSKHPVYSKGLHVAGEADDCALCAGTRAGLVWNAENPQAHRYPGRLTSPWYDDAILDKTDEQVANELDIDRERALSGRVYSEFQTDVHVVAGGIEWQTEFEYKLELAWDYGLDTTAIVVCADMATEYLVLGLVEMGDDHGSTATPELVAARLREYLVELGVPPERATPEWTRRITAFGDPAGHNRETSTNRAITADYRRQGFQIAKPPTRLTRRVDPGISAVKRLLLGTPKRLRVCGVNAETFARHMRNYTWPTDDRGRRRPEATKPRDGEHGHACDAFRYLIVAKFGAPDEPHDPEGEAFPAPEEEDRGPGNLTLRRNRSRDGLHYDMPG